MKKITLNSGLLQTTDIETGECDIVTIESLHLLASVSDNKIKINDEDFEIVINNAEDEVTLIVRSRDENED